MRIVLRPEYSKPPLGADIGNARLRVVVTEADDISKHIFVHQRYTILKSDGPVQENRFLCVAKPGDFNVYPIEVPSKEADTLPYFRLDCIDLVFNSPEELESTMADIIKEVTQLVESMKRLNALEVQPEIVIDA